MNSMILDQLLIDTNDDTSLIENIIIHVMQITTTAIPNVKIVD